MRKLLEKYVIVKYIMGSYVKTLLISLVGFATVFAILELTGVYSGIESALDLKYNSPFVLAPLYGFVILSILCFFIGFLIYFYKYKRSKTKGKFYKIFSNILNENE